MRPALRVTTAAVVTAGLVASTAVFAQSATAVTAPLRTTLTLKVIKAQPIGGYCSVGVKLMTRDGQVGGQKVRVEYRNAGTTSWHPLTTVRTRFGSLVEVKLRRVAAVNYRAFYDGATTPVAYKPDASNLITCTPAPLKFGASGPTVKELQRNLRNLRIRPTSVNGTFDANTLEAVYAFQKATGAPRTGSVSVTTYRQILRRNAIATPTWCKDTTTACVDISQQVLYLKSGKSRYIVPVSSGGEYMFFNPQSKRSERAHTPRGTFRVYYKVPGATTGPLGTYYWISFFNGGYGIHGSASVPPYAASHGCVRVPRSIEQWVYKSLPSGATVIIHD
jgi:N-acetylmuramoyl-L-alanine amidase